MKAPRTTTEDEGQSSPWQSVIENLNNLLQSLQENFVRFMLWNLS